MLAKAFVNIGRYPSLAEVEIQFLELDAFGCGLTKQRERAAAGIVVGILLEVIFDSFGFGDDIPCRFSMVHGSTGFSSWQHGLL